MFSYSRQNINAFSDRLQLYQDATGLTDDEINQIRQKSNLRYTENLRLAQYAYNNADVSGLTSPLIWNDEIINIGIGISFLIQKPYIP